jgi:hypothetical protein
MGDKKFLTLFIVIILFIFHCPFYSWAQDIVKDFVKDIQPESDVEYETVVAIKGAIFINENQLNDKFFIASPVFIEIKKDPDPYCFYSLKANPKLKKQFKIHYTHIDFLDTVTNLKTSPEKFEPEAEKANKEKLLEKRDEFWQGHLSLGAGVSWKQQINEFLEIKFSFNGPSPLRVGSYFNLNRKKIELGLLVQAPLLNFQALKFSISGLVGAGAQVFHLNKIKTPAHNLFGLTFQFGKNQNIFMSLLNKNYWGEKTEWIILGGKEWKADFNLD